MGRKGKAPGDRLSAEGQDSGGEDKREAEARQETPNREQLLEEVREIYHTLIADFKTKRKLKYRSDKPMTGLFVKGDIKKRLQTTIPQLSTVMPDTELHNVLRDFGDGFAEVLVLEIPSIHHREEFQTWVSECSSLMCGIGMEFQKLSVDYLPPRPDMGQEFKLSLLEKSNRAFAEKLSPNGNIRDRIHPRKKSDWLAPKPPSDDPTLGRMSLDQLVNYITDVSEPAPSEPPMDLAPDDFRTELARFRKRLETAASPEHRVVPLLSEEWLHRVSERCHAVV